MKKQKQKRRPSWAALGKILVKDPAQLYRWSKLPWWPKRPMDRDAAACAAVIAANVLKKTAPSKINSSDRRLKQNRDAYVNGNGRNLTPLSESKDPLILEMLGPDASPVTMLRVALRMAAQRLAKSFHNDALSANELDGFKKTSQELRSAESSYIELEVKRASLIPRRDVELIVGEIVGRLVRCSDNLENSIASEFAVWLSDEKIRTMSHDERARMVRAFVEKTNRRVREAESETIDAFLKMVRRDDA